MITGYNTDVEHEGVIYHVQTEDKGLESPIVLSLVYSGGAILAAKRASYADLIATGFEEAALAERLKRQHRLICAAIHAGRIGELRQLSKPQTGRLVDPGALTDQPGEALAETEAPLEAQIADAPTVDTVTELQTEPPIERQPEPVREPAPSAGSAAYTVYDSRRRSRLGEPISEPDGLRITLLGHDPDFHGGEEIQLKAIVTRIASDVEAPLVGAAVSVKILGTTFRPVLLSITTDAEGLMNVSTRIPHFTSGRAAIVVKAIASDLSTEARWVVHPSR